MNEGVRLARLADIYLKMQKEIGELRGKLARKEREFEAFKSIFEEAKEKYSPSTEAKSSTPVPKDL